MIQVDLPTAIVLYLLFSLSLVLAAWIWHGVTHSRKSLVVERKTALQCDICLHSFIASTDGSAARCPRCNSWVGSNQV